MARSQNFVPKVGLILFIVFLAYGLAVVDSNATGSPVEVLGWLGTALLYAAILGTLATIYVAAERAHRAGSWAWFLAVVLFWPLSYVYALGINRGT